MSREDEYPFPSKILFVSSWIVTIFLSVLSVAMIILGFLCVKNIMFVILGIYFALVPYYFHRDAYVYVNEKEKYLRIKNEKIPFEGISNVRCTFLLKNPIKYSIFSFLFTVGLQDGTERYFATFYRGSNGPAIAKLRELGITVI